MLIAPNHLRGKMTKHTSQALRDERTEWAANAGRAGWSSYAVADALNISQFAARRIMCAGGWEWWKQKGKRIIRK